MSDIAENKVVMIILAILLPPVAVYLKSGTGTDLIINIVLWIVLFGIGGILHALWIILR